MGRALVGAIVSASNWAACPRCQAQAKAAAREQREKIHAAHDTMTHEDFEAALAQVPLPHPGKYETFREDYYIHGAETGTVTVSYGGSCETCGLALSFEHEHPIPGLAE